MILLVISLFSLRSNNSVMQTPQKNATIKQEALWCFGQLSYNYCKYKIDLKFCILRIVAIKIGSSRSGWTDHEFLVVNPSRDTWFSYILSLQAPKIIWGCPGTTNLLCHLKWHLKYLATHDYIVWLH